MFSVRSLVALSLSIYADLVWFFSGSIVVLSVCLWLLSVCTTVRIFCLYYCLYYCSSTVCLLSVFLLFYLSVCFLLRL